MSENTLLITGASSGIGAATAKHVARAGWRVALAARSSDKLAELVEEIGKDWALAIQADVTQEKDVKRMLEEAADFGDLAAVFANAGLGATDAGSEKGDTDNWRNMIDVNIWGLCLTVKYALPLLKPQRGHVLLTGSRAAHVTLSGSVYGATKSFVHGYARNLTQEMAEWGGRCTVIAPGMVDTPFFDSPKPEGLRVEDVAHAVLYALEQPHGVNVDEVLLTPRT